MTIDEAYKILPEISKIDISLINSLSKKIISKELDINSTFGDQGFSELDIVEMVMEIELQLDISIEDNIAEFLFGIDSKPTFLIQQRRAAQIDKILNI